MANLKIHSVRHRSFSGVLTYRIDGNVVKFIYYGHYAKYHYTFKSPSSIKCSFINSNALYFVNLCILNSEYIVRYE